MEWAVLALVASLAAACIGWPWTRRGDFEAHVDALRERRERLMRELAELDGDLAEGRISAADRRDGRRALAPELRAVTEALRARGEGATGLEVGG